MPKIVTQFVFTNTYPHTKETITDDEDVTPPILYTITQTKNMFIHEIYTDDSCTEFSSSLSLFKKYAGVLIKCSGFLTAHSLSLNSIIAQNFH